jgi:hypothetical protein
MMKSRVRTVIWCLAGVMWAIFGLLYLELHYRFFGVTFLVMGAVALFIAVRYRKKAAAEVPPRQPENHSAGNTM